MHLLIACTTSWFFLLGAFLATWAVLPEPRSTTDFAILIVIGTAAVAFARIGLVSGLTLLIRLLPAGRIRSTALRTVLRLGPRVLRSSVIVAASASLAVQAAHASPVSTEDFDAADQVTMISATSTAGTASAAGDAANPALDPGWPIAAAKSPPPDPSWPTTPPAPEPEPPQESEPTPDQVPPPEGEETAPANVDDDEVHIVGTGESLWSIAISHPASGMATQDIVDEIYTNNREQIGANPNLIMPGQRLEIAP